MIFYYHYACYGNVMSIIIFHHFQGPVFLRVQSYPCRRQESRALTFSEERAHWQIPINESNIICDVKTKDGKHKITVITNRKPTEHLFRIFYAPLCIKQRSLVLVSCFQAVGELSNCEC